MPKGFGYFGGRELTDLELLAQLQHFKAATMLLDFSEQALVALYFACADKMRSDGKIFIIKAGMIKHVQTKENIENIINSNEAQQWRPTLHGLAERRMMAQSGLFMMNLGQKGSYVKTIDIGKQDKSKLLEELNNRFQISANTLFMDLAGYAENQSSSCKFDDPFVQFYRAIIYERKEKFKEAIKCLTNAIRKKPNFASAYSARGNCKLKENQFKEAIKDLDKVIQLKADNELTHYHRGISNYELGNIEIAKRDQKKALEIATNKSEFEMMNKIKIEIKKLKH